MSRIEPALAANAAEALSISQPFAAYRASTSLDDMPGAVVNAAKRDRFAEMSSLLAPAS